MKDTSCTEYGTPYIQYVRHCTPVVSTQYSEYIVLVVCTTGSPGYKYWPHAAASCKLLQESRDIDFTTMLEPLPVPSQLKAQLDKCKVMRDDKYYKSREKTSAEIKASKAKLPPLPTAPK